MTTLKGRLELALAQRDGATKAGLARACGVSKPAVSAWFSGAAQAMTGDNLLAAAKYLGIRPDWLASGRGPMLPFGALGISTDDRGATYSDTLPDEGSSPGNAVPARKLPLFRWEQVGELEKMQGNQAAIAFAETPFESSEGSYLLELSSEAMMPDFRPGEVIQVDPELAARHGDDVIVILPGGRAIFRRLIDGEEGRMLQALNPQWPERLTMMPAGSKVVGVIVGSWMARRK